MKFVFATDIHISSVTPGSRIDNYTETVFKKIEYVLQQCVELEAEALLLGGDIFATPTVPDHIKNRLKALILKYGVRVLGIPGNHDLLYYNMEYIDRTSYQALVSPGVMENLEDYTNNEVKIGDWSIMAHEFAKPFPRGVDKKTIILSHCFYEYGHEDRLSVKRQEVYQSGAGFVCFGHDHNQYKQEMQNGCMVVRPGALTRGTSHTENRVRKVGYAVIDTETMTAEYVGIPFARNFDEVFRENYEVKRDRKPVSFVEIQEFINDLRNAKLEVNPYDILLAMDRSKNTVERTTHYLEAVGLVKT
jgi:exonuclease SbcD